IHPIVRRKTNGAKPGLKRFGECGFPRTGQATHNNQPRAGSRSFHDRIIARREDSSYLCQREQCMIVLKGVLTSSGRYSALNATLGSIREARTPGSRQANRPIRLNRNTAEAKIVGSKGAVSKRSCESVRVASSD